MKWTYAATDLRSGAVVCDALPLEVTSFERLMGDSAPMTASLDLSADPAWNRLYLPLMRLKRTVIWALGDGYPRWGGILWDAPHQSALQANLPLSISSIESIFDRRRIHDNLTYTQVDQFDIFRALVSYALGKPYGSIASFTVADGLSGVLRDRTYLATDHGNVLEALQNLAGVDDGFEWTCEPVWVDETTGVPGWLLTLGYPTLGRPVLSTGTVLTMPGNVVDYAWPRTGSRSANSMRAVGDTTTDGSGAQMISSTAHGVATDELAAGYPLLEDTLSYAGQGITDTATLNAHADADVTARKGEVITPSITLQDDQEPKLGDYAMGDGAYFQATSMLHPAVLGDGGAPNLPGLQTTVRLFGWVTSPASVGSPGETVKLTLASVEGVEE